MTSRGFSFKREVVDRPFNAVPSRCVGAVVKRIRALWKDVRPYAEKKEYLPSVAKERYATYNVIYRHMVKREAVQRIHDIISSWDYDRIRTSAHGALARRIGEASSQGRSAAVWAYNKLKDECNSSAAVTRLAASFSIKLLASEHSMFEKRHRRWLTGSVAVSSYWVPGKGSPGSKTAGMPPELPESSVKRRIAQVVGTRPQKVLEGVNLPLDEYLRECRPDVVSRLPKGLVYVPSGSFETSALHLGQYFSGEAKAPPEEDRDKAIACSADTLHIVRLGNISTDAFATTGVNPWSAPGFDSKDLGKNKGNLIDTMHIACSDLWNRLEKEQLLDASGWELGGREKRQWKEADEPLRSRVIMQPEALLSQFGCAIAHPITLALQREKGDLFIGWTYAHGKWREFVEKFDCEHVKAFDWSQFDARVSEELMVDSMGILRSFYPPGRQMDRAFIYLLSNLIFKDVIIPGGYVVRVPSGVPSGHPFTSLLDSVANWLIHRDVNYSLGGQRLAEHVKLGLLGDDTIAAYPKGYLAPQTEDYVNCAYKRWGMVGKVDFNLEGFLTSTNASICLPFLGTRFQCGLPGMSLEDWVTMDLGDKSPRRQYGWRSLEIVVYRGLPPFCAEQWDLHAALCKWCLERDKSPIKSNTPEGLQAVITSVYEFASLVYLTSTTGYFSWGEDMQGVRRRYDEISPRIRGFPKVNNRGDFPYRYTDEQIARYDECVSRASVTIPIDPHRRRELGGQGDALRSEAWQPHFPVPALKAYATCA